MIRAPIQKTWEGSIEGLFIQNGNPMHADRFVDEVAKPRQHGRQTRCTGFRHSIIRVT